MQILYSFWNLLHAMLFIFYFSQSSLSNNQATKWRSEWGRHFVTVSLKAKRNNGKALNEKKKFEEPKGACNITATELLSRSFILLYCKVETKPHWDATQPYLSPMQVKYSLAWPFFILSRAFHLPKQRLFCVPIYCVPYGFKTTHWQWLSCYNPNHILPLKVQTLMFSITAPGTLKCSA